MINRLITKSIDASSREALKFIILNDTLHLFHYDRALLWSFESGTGELLGVSGQTTIDHQSSLANKWQSFIEAIPDKTRPSLLFGQDFAREHTIWNELQARSQTTII